MGEEIVHEGEGGIGGGMKREEWIAEIMWVPE